MGLLVPKNCIGLPPAFNNGDIRLILRMAIKQLHFQFRFQVLVMFLCEQIIQARQRMLRLEVLVTHLKIRQQQPIMLAVKVI